MNTSMCKNDWNIIQKIINCYYSVAYTMTGMDTNSHASRHCLMKVERSDSVIRSWRPRRCAMRSPASIQRRTDLVLTFNNLAISPTVNSGGRGVLEVVTGRVFRPCVIATPVRRIRGFRFPIHDAAHRAGDRMTTCNEENRCS
jgi:hypothetical protein